MSNIIGIVGPALNSRHEYISKVMPEVSPFSWLKKVERNFVSTTLAWAAIPSAPISISERGDGFSAFVLGSLGRDGESVKEVSDAEYILKQYEMRGPGGMSGQNSFFAVCVFDPGGDVCVATDTLGLFPIYYHSTPNWLLFSTAFSSFHHFPRFRSELSPQGLAGILLTMHMVSGQTILKGVRRLSPGHVLHWKAGVCASERRADPLKPSCEHFGTSFKEHVDLFDESLKDIVQRETSDYSTHMLLSGGLDSRILAGCLRRTNGAADIKAVTFGAGTDHEMRCASMVAARQGWPHVQVPVDFSSFVESAWLNVKLEGMSNGLTGLAWASGISGLPDVESCVVAGLLGDAVMGGSHILWGCEKGQRCHSFDAMFKKINRLGLNPEVVKRLVHPDILGDSLDEVMEDLRKTYESFDGLPFQRSLLFDLMYRQRLFVGALAWRMSFRAWPVLPYAERKVLDLACSMPGSTLLHRRLQIDLLRWRYPSLARLPLDRNWNDTYSILGPLYREIPGVLWERLKERFRKAQVERRYLYRVGDINNPGWTAVRREAEAYRRKSQGIFNPSELEKALPAADTTIVVRDMVTDTWGIQLLLGILLFNEKYL